MANYMAAARSNYFRVKDIVAFREWAEGLGLEVHPGKEIEGDASFMISPGWGSDAGWPICKWDEDAEEFQDVDLCAELAEHLHANDIAVLMESGWEKLRYLVGVAWAVDCHGNVERLSIDDIYEKASARFGRTIQSDATY